MARNFKVEVEAPHEEVRIMTLKAAVDKYLLEESDIERLEEGGIVWINREIAISKCTEEL